MPISVSVVLTCHNLGKYIGPAIESVLSQDYEGDIELVVVDDLSTDNSFAVICRYPEVIKLSTPTNYGVLMATVFGLRHVTNDVVFFLDGDDIWDHEKIRLCMSFFGSNPKVGLVTHDLRYIDSGGSWINTDSKPERVFSQHRGDSANLVRKGILHHSDYVWLGSAYAIKRSAINCDEFCDWAEKLPDTFNTYQDWPLAYWVASQAQVRMAYVPEKLFSYRIHGENYSGDARSKEKALRNLRRSFNTMSAILDICDKFGLEGKAHDITRQKVRYYDYLRNLYAGQKITSLFQFITLQPYVFTSSLSTVKEWVRFFAIQFLGTDRFLRISKR